MADASKTLPTGRIPPHNLEAEASVLGSALVDNEAIDRVEGLITADSFYKEAHRKIWRAIEALRSRSEPVDLVTLSEELKKRGELEEVGGLTYLVGLSESTPTAAYADHYARIVAEKAALRRLISAAGEAMRLAYDEAGSVEEIIDQAGRLILEVATHGPRHEFQEMRELVTRAHERIAALREEGAQTDLISTGFADLDRLIGGLAPGSLNIIAARPSMGKTAFALTIAQNVALRDHVPVAIFSLEMPAIDLVLRMLSSEARVDMNRIRQAQLSDRDYDRLVKAASRIYDAPIYIDDTPGLTLMEVRARARRLAVQNDVKLIVIDYMQLMSGGQSSRNGENRQQEIAAISRGLKSLARELEVPVVALSQLSRAVESRPNKRPMLSDLRESGSIEQDADLVVFIYRDDYYNEHSEKAGIAEIIVGKQRNGPIGTVELQFHAAHVRFNDLARGEF
ncbi:replicative DNA helicase [Oceanithermus sp.]